MAAIPPRATQQLKCQESYCVYVQNKLSSSPQQLGDNTNNVRNVEASALGVGASNGLRTSLEFAEVVFFFFFFRIFHGIVKVRTCWSGARM